MAMDEPLSLLALKGKRVKQMQQMKEKTVAVCRLSCTDYWCQRMVTENKLELSQIFRSICARYLHRCTLIPACSNIPMRWA